MNSIHSNERLRKEIKSLGFLLGEVLIEQEGRKLFEKVESLRALTRKLRVRYNKPTIEKIRSIVKNLDLGESHNVIRAFSIYMEKVNLTKIVSAIFLLLIIIPLKPAIAWGEKGHKIINRKAVDYLPEEMKDFRAWKDYLGDHASDADIRRFSDKTEAPKHFIDIDYYKEFLAGRMIENKDSLISVYGEETVKKIGLLPWATLDTFNNLIKAFKDRNRDRALIYASDLGHYVADGHQPMHTVVNYNGQLTNQKGVHARYESNMINRYYQEIENSFGNCHASLIQKPVDYIFSYITNANSVCGLLFDADNFAAKQAEKTEGDDYYRLMWFRTKYITEVQFNKAAQDLAALIYTAWVDAGKPGFAEFK